MLRWKIGDVRVTRIVELEFPWRYSPQYPFIKEARPEALRDIPWLYPHYVTADDALVLSVHALLVDAPGLRLIVDTCVGNDRPREFTLGRALQTPFLDHLKEAGWPRENVNAVVCTHLHVDHVGWNTMLDGDKFVPTFPNARYLIGRKEFEHWNSETEEERLRIMADSIAPIFDAGLAQMVEMDHRISPEIRLMPTTGHTPGHVSVVIESKGRTAIITGDVFHHPCQMARPDWAPAFDVDQAAATRTRHNFLKEFADRPVLVIGTHFAAPTAGHIVRDGAAYRFRV
jgi:glyoxylase-like metal-dependent hydrolase (beta-lactamase superfamily II)